MPKCRRQRPKSLEREWYRLLSAGVYSLDEVLKLVKKTVNTKRGSSWLAEFKLRGMCSVLHSVQSPYPSSAVDCLDPGVVSSALEQYRIRIRCIEVFMNMSACVNALNEQHRTPLEHSIILMDYREGMIGLKQGYAHSEFCKLSALVCGGADLGLAALSQFQRHSFEVLLHECGPRAIEFMLSYGFRFVSQQFVHYNRSVAALSLETLAANVVRSHSVRYYGNAIAASKGLRERCLIPHRCLIYNHSQGYTMQLVQCGDGKLETCLVTNAERLRNSTV